MPEARDALLEAAALDPDAPGTWVQLAQVHRALGDMPRARSALDRALASPDSTEHGFALMLEGSMHMVDGRAPEALRSFDEATRWIPRDEQTWFLLAKTLQRQGNHAGALEACRRGLASASTTERLRGLLSELGGGG
jgi:tetratricopeptide (TPR) repeat protein